MMLTGLLLLLGTVVTVVSGDELAQTLDALCRNDTTVELRRISQVRDIAEELRNNGAPGLCAEATRRAITDAYELLEEGNLQNVCSKIMVKKIRLFYFEHIDKQDDEDRIPIPLNKFFHGFALKVSAACKRRLFDSLLEDSEKYISGRDIEMIASNTGYDGFITKWLTKTGDYNDLLLACEMGRLTLLDGRPTKKNLYVKTLVASQIRDMQNACRRSIKPFYEPLINPLIGLSSIGFNYKQEKELKRMSKNSIPLRNWFKMIYLCESLSHVILFDFSEEERLADEIERKTIYVLGEEEARMFGGLKPEFHLDEPLFAYKPDPVEIEDEVLSASDEVLIKAVDKLAFPRRKFQYLKKVGRILKDTIVGNEVRLVGNYLKHHRKNLAKTLKFGPVKDEDELKANILAELDNFTKDNDVGQFSYRVNISEGRATEKFIDYYAMFTILVLSVGLLFG